MKPKYSNCPHRGLSCKNLLSLTSIDQLALARQGRVLDGWLGLFFFRALGHMLIVWVLQRNFGTESEWVRLQTVETSRWVDSEYPEWS